MHMTYDEAIEENPIITRARAEQECLLHAVRFAEMISDLGDLTVYPARDVLVWLGY